VFADSSVRVAVGANNRRDTYGPDRDDVHHRGSIFVLTLNATGRVQHELEIRPGRSGLPLSLFPEDSYLGGAIALVAPAVPAPVGIIARSAAGSRGAITAIGCQHCRSRTGDVMLLQHDPTDWTVTKAVSVRD